MDGSLEKCYIIDSKINIFRVYVCVYVCQNVIYFHENSIHHEMYLVCVYLCDKILN